MSESTSYHHGSISFTTMPPVLSDSQKGSVEDIQISLAPYIQNYLSQTGRRHSCCSVMLPVAFERAAHKSWLDPHFDSAVLEGQYQASVFPQIRLRFRFALFYILLCSLIWLLYFLSDGGPSNYWQLSLSIGIIIVISLVCLWITYTNLYRAHTSMISATCAIVLCSLSLVLLVFTGNALSPLGHFSICIEIVLLIYTVIPLPLWLCFTISSLYSVAFEILSFFIQTHHYQHSSQSVQSQHVDHFVYKILVIRIILHICVHLLGIHILIMTVVRMRGTFMKVGQNLLVRRQLEMEKQLKEKMIHSMMPPKVADMLMRETGSLAKGTSFDQYDVKQYARRSIPSDLKTLFRPFHMNSMDNVSILFADIVGFTKMSSTKTAEQLVEILNDLFERFDDLCSLNGCEKISTLGDCYYCVSGCPEPRPDHAICCVEMGLGMIQAMKLFDAQRDEGVKMRVGIHTGTVLCGIVGTKRVKFDVWSNDVTLANRMESSGRPEQVHVSEETCSFLGDAYILEEGEEVYGHRTYFVLGKRQDLVNSMSESASNLDVPRDNSRDVSLVVSPTDEGFLNGVKLSHSATNLSAVHPSVPPASPIGIQFSTSLNPSPVLGTSRQRLASLTKLANFLKPGTNTSDKNIKELNNPTILVNTKSLPNGIDSDNEDQNKFDEICLRPGKYSSKFRNWKMSKLLRKNDSFEQKDCDKKSEEVPCLEQNGGYQQLPIVVVTPRPSHHTLDIPQVAGPALCRPSIRLGSRLSSPVAENNSSISQNSVFDDIIDIRSYISQSRSDISPFGRSGSYRSQCGRASHNDFSPTTGRPRSSTIASMAGNGHSHFPRPIWSNDIVSLCPSATSRKDSGIRSNSRRSSIQQQIYAVNQINQSAIISQHRVSGYFTSSQSSLSNVISTVPEPTITIKKNGNINDANCTINKEPHPDPLAACLQTLRKQSDLQLIRCVRDNAKSQRSYLVKPPIKPISLRFKSRQMEHEFRSKAHRFGKENEEEGPPTLATPKYNTYLDILVSFIIYISTSISLFLLSPSVYLQSYKIWVCVFVAFSTIQFAAVFLTTKQVCRRTHKPTKNHSTIVPNPSCSQLLIRQISNWYPWHICGAVLMSLPVVSILTNFSLMDVEKFKIFEFHYGFLIFLCIVHFCNFTQLNFGVRNVIAFITAISFVGIAIKHMVHLNDLKNVELHNLLKNSTYETEPLLQQQIDWFDSYRIEIYVDLILLLIMVWFLNREFEIGYRLSFYGSAVARQDKVRVQNMKNQADMLLHNIIPKHVAEQLKNTAKYSENHHNVGIIFASIVNFNEMYDESYLGGKEYLRVLNELIGDFDELLARPEFQCVEKIKTIGSTFMAASGLDPSSKGDDNEHLFMLMDFALAMQQVVESFNRDLLEFNLVIRVGYNFGDVTAGVIGTSKLYYDIWGDAVNVASRMDSTGVAGRIQVRNGCVPILEERYDFEQRGKVYVKGKDHMEVSLLIAKKPDLLGPPELDTNKY